MVTTDPQDLQIAHNDGLFEKQNMCDLDPERFISFPMHKNRGNLMPRKLW